ncbi:MAG: hypothetical protein Ct9H300mP13_4260 [Gammaproteobacteria bacterium]|nr:MAG: hypothetical protein Ct9H300mP13_4260 [Gammaproteobacteria bacterium]
MAGRAAYMVQTSAVSTSDTIEMTQHAKDIGADAPMVLPPYFEGPNMEGSTIILKKSQVRSTFR